MSVETKEINLNKGRLKNIFWKLTGAGNDFVLIEDRIGLKLSKLALRLCHRKFGIGADGLLAVKKNGKMLSVRYFNSDGSEAFCGNGSRCSAFWAWKEGIFDKNMVLETKAGFIKAKIISSEVVELEMPSPQKIKLFLKGSFSSKFPNVHFADSGVPHAVIEVKDERKIDVDREGREIRFNKVFSPDGANVNFVALRNKTLFIRTYERGVEGETLACGTGIVASACVFWQIRKIESPINIISKSGMKFKVYIEGDKSISKIFAQGPVKMVFKGEVL